MNAESKTYEVKVCTAVIITSDKAVKIGKSKEVTQKKIYWWKRHL